MRFIGRVACICSVSLFVALSVQAKEPLSVDDIYRMESFTDFTVSPDGKEAVYVRNWYDVNSPGRRTALWRIDGETGRAAPLEPGEPDGRMPVYSPNNKWLAYVSSRPRGDHQEMTPPPYSDPTGHVWVMDRHESGDVMAPRMSWRFRHHVDQILTDTFYGRMSFSANSMALLAVSGDSGGNGVPDVIGNLIVDDQGEGYEGFGPARISFLAPDPHHSTNPFGHQWIREQGKWYGDPQWSLNGEFLVFHANRTDDQESVRYSINKNFDLWRLAIYDTNRPPNPFSTEDAKLNPVPIWPEPLQLTKNPGPDVSPRISPDGKHVLYLSVPRKGPHADVYNLAIIDLDGNDTNERVLVNAHDAERQADGTPPFQPTFPLRDDSWIDNEHVRVRGVRGMKTETLVFNIAGPEAPIAATAKPEPDSRNPKLKLPPVNEWLSDRYEAREEIVRWKSFDGLEIEGILTLPPAELTQFKQPYPLIVYPHGGPHSASKPGFNFTAHVFAAQGYAVFQPNFRGTYGYGRKFLDAARFDMGGSDMQDILTGIDALVDRGIVDRKRQFVYGISYGGYSTCRLITLTNQFKAACAQNAVTDLHAMWHLSDLQSWTEWEFGGKPWETVEHEGRKIDVGALMRDRSPTTHAHKVKTPTLILHSDHDRRCPLPMGTMFYRALKESGCETEMVVYKDERHAMWQVKHQADVLQRTLDWFKSHDVAR